MAVGRSRSAPASVPFSSVSRPPARRISRPFSVNACCSDPATDIASLTRKTRPGPVFAAIAARIVAGWTCTPSLLGLRPSCRQANSSRRQARPLLASRSREPAYPPSAGASPGRVQLSMVPGMVPPLEVGTRLVCASATWSATTPRAASTEAKR